MPDVQVVHVATRTHDVYIGRPSKWGNPFVIGRDGDRAEVIAKFDAWLDTQPQLLAALPELHGKVLGCFCAPLPCHGDVLARRAQSDSVVPGATSDSAPRALRPESPS